MDTIPNAAELYGRGKMREAELVCETRLAAAPDDADALELLVEIYRASGRTASSVPLLTQLTRVRPLDGAAHRRLGEALLSEQRPAEAAAALRAAIGVEPANTRAHNNLGQALMQLGDVPGAIASYQEALRLAPRYAIGHNNLGLALAASGRLEQAAECFRRAIALAPAPGPAQLNLAATLTRDAFALSSIGRAADALGRAEEALRLNGSPEAHHARAGALRQLGRRSEALESLELAVALRPDYTEAWCNRGIVLHELGEFDAAIRSYRRALELDPDNVQSRSRLLARLIPSVPLSEAEAESARRAFEAELAALEAWLSRRHLSDADALAACQQQFFYLTYDERSNRELLERYRGACAGRLAGAPTSAAAAMSDASGRRFKLGFASAQVYDHSVYNAILRGWLETLDRGRFELTLFSVGTKHDVVTQSARGCVEHFATGVRPIDEWARTIRDRELDALIFPEIGMNESILALASLRLAPHQLAAWGHPETSGLPSIDSYLSAELFEPADAQAHYTERLVRLPNLGVHYQPYGGVSEPIDLERLGAARKGPIFICAGVPFKYRPQDDRIFPEIARRLGDCVFVFFQYEVPELHGKLQARIAAAFSGAGLDPARHLVSIPWQPRAAFFGLLREADVYLDTLGFSGFNTMMQAVESHLPCVTYEGKFMRGRFGSAILRHLGLADCVASDREQYIERAVRLATDAEYRAGIRGRMRRAEARAYRDVGAVRALAELLLAAR